jgi:long-chain acyl-CoA synthetase
MTTTMPAVDEGIVRGGPAPEPGTLNAIFFDAIERYDKPDALMHKVGGTYHKLSHREVERRVRHAAIGLGTLGVRRYDRVAILAENRPEWAITDYACLTTGVTDVPIYPTLPPDQIAYILRDSGAVAIFVSTAEQAAKIASIRSQLPSLLHVISFDEVGPSADMTLAGLEQRGAAAETPQTIADYRAGSEAVEPDDLATLIYTSGTTGNPKGVMLTHNNIRSNVEATRDLFRVEPGDVALSFLPLSHIFERMGDYLMWTTGVSIAYAESLDTVPVNMVEIRPTMVFSVPRLYEKMYARVLQNALSGGLIKKKIFFWARDVAEKWADVKLAGGEPGGMLARKYALAQKLVFSKLKARTGGRLRYFVSGGAPLAPEINKFFYAAGLLILEGYGLTETSPVIGVNTEDHFRIGTIGRPVAGVEVKIAPDGEILARGPGIMKGYYNNPEATAEVMDEEGWFHTGDIGELDDIGRIRITDRLKNIIVLGNGKNVSPGPMEAALSASKYVAQAVILGDNQPYTGALIAPDFEELGTWAKANGLGELAPEQLIEAKEVQKLYDGEVKRALDAFAIYERPRRTTLLPRALSEEDGELTPTLKTKMRVVQANWGDKIAYLFDEKGGGEA